MKTLNISTDFIDLGSALKLLNIVSSGGEAKYFLKENDVYINGSKEERRGRKLYPNDKIFFNEEEILIKNVC